MILRRCSILDGRLFLLPQLLTVSPTGTWTLSKCGISRSDSAAAVSFLSEHQSGEHSNATVLLSASI